MGNLEILENKDQFSSIQQYYSNSNKRKKYYENFSYT